MNKGLVHDWNLAHPSRPVRSGDRFVEVNGTRDITRWAEELKRCQVLTVTLLAIQRNIGFDEMLQVEPQDAFHFNRSTESRTELYIENISCKNVAYKVKVDAPLSFFVHPYTGSLCPGDSISVQITHKPGSDVTCQAPHLLVQAVCETQETRNKVWAEFPQDLIKQRELDVFIEEAPDAVMRKTEALLKLNPGF